jgi:hypothetical protein
LDGHKPKFYYVVVKTSGRIFGSASMRRRNQRHQHHLPPNPEHPEAVLKPPHPNRQHLIDVQQG